MFDQTLGFSFQIVLIFFGARSLAAEHGAFVAIVGRVAIRDVFVRGVEQLSGVEFVVAVVQPA